MINTKLSIALARPLWKRLPTSDRAYPSNHAAGGGNGPIMVGMFVCLCLASKKPSVWEFFVPVGTDLAVTLLTALPLRRIYAPNFLLSFVLA